tara:strand:+ start:325 stop:597 length:273 start_codon:yes stop_codon:yes gene_type:complete
MLKETIYNAVIAGRETIHSVAIKAGMPIYKINKIIEEKSKELSECPAVQEAKIRLKEKELWRIMDEEKLTGVKNKAYESLRTELVMMRIK